MNITRKRTALIALCVAAFVSASACRSAPSASPEERDQKAQIAEEQKEIEEELAEPDKAEARSWLTDSSHTIWEGDKDEVIKLVNDLYTRGATQVYATGIANIGDVDVTATLVVVLPTDPPSRRRIFEAEAFFMQTMGEEPTPDIGQKYLKFIFD